MKDYREYILALKKCAAEHDNDIVSFGHIRVSDLCRATAKLLEELSSSESPNKSEIPTGSAAENDLAVDCISRNTVLTLINDVKNANGFSEYSKYEYLFDKVDTMPSVTPQQKHEDIAKAFQIGLLFGFGEKQDNIDRIIDEIKLVAPTRKKGKWVIKATGFPPEPMTVCSECGFDRDYYIFPRGCHKMKFCPNCGAEMESKE
jgi:hypothetical protein